MRKVTFLSLIILTFVFVSCTSREKKAQKLVENYLSYLSNYNSLEFGNLDSLFSTYNNTVEGKDLREKSGITGTFYQRANELKVALTFENDPEKISLYEDSIRIYEVLADEFETKYNEKEKEYKSDFIGWKMKHRFRLDYVPNIINAETTQMFHFDKDITKIIYTDFE
jgi:hypothetical protein